MTGTRTNTSNATGANLVAPAGLGLIAYSLALLVRNFTGFVELDLIPEHVSKTPEEIQSFSPDLYSYISHVQIANSGFIIALAIFGIRQGERWTLWTALLVPIIGLAIAISLHYPFDFATFGHLAPLDLDMAILLLGVILSYRAIRT